MDTQASIRLRPATAEDLDAVNAIVDAAVMSWDLPERVKRLVLPIYRYQREDLGFLELFVATTPDDLVVGVAALETADPADCINAEPTLLLHGLYVLPGHQRQGIGSMLLEATEEIARLGNYRHLLVKAQADAKAFFEARGLDEIPITDSGRDYPHRFKKAITDATRRQISRGADN